MTEVSAWNAVDASNNATPPDGFPEGMQPSAVNDAARMMMGALRREHDLITAKIGTVAGSINTTTINATTVNTTGAITASGPITGTAVNSTGNASVAGTLTASGVNVTGTLTASAVTVTGTTIVLNGRPVLFSPPASSGNFTILYGNDGNGALFLGGNTSYLRQGNQYFQAQDTTNYALFMSLGTYNQSGSWGTFSDVSLKQDIAPYERGLEAILELNPVTYRYQPGTPFATADAASRALVGLIADDVRAHIPEMVGEATITIADQDRTVNTLVPGDLLYVLVNAVKQLAERVAQLEEEKA